MFKLKISVYMCTDGGVGESERHGRVDIEKLNIRANRPNVKNSHFIY